MLIIIIDTETVTSHLHFALIIQFLFIQTRYWIMTIITRLIGTGEASIQ